MSSKTIPKAGAAGEGRQLRHRRRRAAGDRVQRPARGAREADEPRRHACGSTPARSRSTRCASRSSSGSTPAASSSCRGTGRRRRCRTWTSTGNAVKPDKPNAVKLEQFVFDAIPLAKNAIVYETDRAEEFCPVKNAEGVDSPATCRRDQIRRAARWLSGAGVEVPTKDGEPDATLEISPLLRDAARAAQAARAEAEGHARGRSSTSGATGSRGTCDAERVCAVRRTVVAAATRYVSHVVRITISTSDPRLRRMRSRR